VIRKMHLHSYLRVASFLLVLLCALLVLMEDAWAQNIVDVDVKANFSPVAAVGIIMVGGDTRQETMVKFEQVNEGNVVVSFPYSRSDLDKHATVSAIVVSEEGELAFGSVKPVRYDVGSIHSIPQCEEESVISTVGLESQVALLESLLQIRSERRSTYQANLNRELSGDFLNRLMELESGLGLQAYPALSPDTDPVELTDRLSRLKNSIQQFKARKTP